MSQFDQYLQFPLCALSFGETTYQRLNAILDYGVVHAGIRLWQKESADEKSRFLAFLPHRSKIPQGFEPNDPRHCAVLYGIEKVGVIYSNLDGLLVGHGTLEAFKNEFERRFGRDATVRIRKKWLFQARDGKGLTYREFAVLCAIYSCIGSKQFTRITRERAQHRSLGYKNKSTLQAELPRRADGAQPLTERQVRDTIDRLHGLRFFARCTYGRRVTYYSHRLTDEQLRKYVMKKHIYPVRFHRIQADKDRSLTEQIRQARIL